LRELEKSRMNFLRQGRGGFTYRTMLISLACWCVLLAVIYVIGVMRVSSAEDELAGVKARIDSLNSQKDAQLKLMASVGSSRVGAATKNDLAAIIMARPHWSRVLRELTRSLPPQVWLQSIKVLQEKDEEARLEIAGKAKSQRQLTNFIMSLESTDLFNKTALLGTKKGSDKEAEFEYDIITTPILSKF